MCAQAGHEDANLSFRDASPEKITRLADTIKRLAGQGVGRTDGNGGRPA
jgi:hypothetical protein